MPRGYHHRPPWWMRLFYGQARWRMSPMVRALYLSFDDGPEPEVTLPVLELLRQYEAKASFFCLGEQAERHPEIVLRCLAEGHAVGHHGYRHLNAWQQSPSMWRESMLEGAEAMEKITDEPHRLFRPPYGKLPWFKGGNPLPSDWQIVLWDLMPGDFDTRLSAEAVAEAAISRFRPGSIMVLHDSLAAWPRLRKALPTIVEAGKAQGYEFLALPSD